MPQKVDIVVMRNDNKTNIKTIKVNVTTFPTSIQVTGQSLQHYLIQLSSRR
jgi:hypothetical protein